jgi:hypothetical protein
MPAERCICVVSLFAPAETRPDMKVRACLQGSCLIDAAQVRILYSAVKRESDLSCNFIRRAAINRMSETVIIHRSDRTGSEIAKSVVHEN